MSDIYDQHRAAFATVSAYVVLDSDCKLVATVAVRYPAKGLRLWAYVRILGTPMTRGSASGGGYDKTSAAVSQAIAKALMSNGRDDPEARRHVEAYRKARVVMDGYDWDRALRDAGYQILQAV